MDLHSWISKNESPNLYLRFDYIIYLRFIKDETDLVYSTYGDDVGVQYAESVLNYARECEFATVIGERARLELPRVTILTTCLFNTCACGHVFGKKALTIPFHSG